MDEASLVKRRELENGEGRPDFMYLRQDGGVSAKIELLWDKAH